MITNHRTSLSLFQVGGLGLSLTEYMLLWNVDSFRYLDSRGWLISKMLSEVKSLTWTREHAPCSPLSEKQCKVEFQTKIKRRFAQISLSRKRPRDCENRWIVWSSSKVCGVCFSRFVMVRTWGRWVGGAVHRGILFDQLKFYCLGKFAVQLTL